MLVTPPTPSSLVAPPPGQSSARKSNSKRHRGLGLLRSHIQSLHIHPQTPPLSPSSSSENTDLPSSSTDASSASSSAPSLAPPSIQRPAENQSVGYFPDLSTNPSALDRTNTVLPSIEEDVVSDGLSPGASSAGSSNSASSENGRRSRSMARRRAGSITSSILGPNIWATHRDHSSSSRSAERIPQNLVSPESQNGESSSMPANTAEDSSKLAGLPADQMPTIRFIPYQDPRSSKPSLAFTATSRTLPHEGCVIRVGRYSERDTSPAPAPNVPSAAPVGFKSKVVSRRHCEFWCSQGQWYVRDVKSSSGTFLNHIRLSSPSTESRPFPVNDSDIIQLGMDFRGGEESIFRCVKIRIECNRAWQKSLNSFNMATHKQLRALQHKDGDSVSTSSTECSICLMPVAPCQSLFVAPCSHVWHFKCIRPILSNDRVYPQFLCPNCRAVADLEADIEDTLDTWEEADDDDGSVSEEPTSEKKTAVPLENGPSLIADGSADDGDMAEHMDDMISHLSLSQRNSMAPLEEIGASRPSRRSHYMTDETLDVIGEPLSTAPTPSNALRDPRTAAETLEGVVTPRNEAGPFVFDGSNGSINGGRMPSALAAPSAEGAVV